MTDLFLLLVTAAGAALLFPQAGAAQPLAMHEEDGMRWACGGIGVEEREALDEFRPRANAELVFVAEPRGAYLVDIIVAVYADRRDTPELRVRSQGPVCLLHLPAGRYRIEASRHGAHRVVQVRGGGPDGRAPRTIFTFPEEP